MLKRILIFLTAICLFSSLGVIAAENEFTITPDGEFYQYPKDTEKMAEILSADQKSLDEYCALGGIEYFAVNEDNTKQIKISYSKTQFSENVSNISNLSDDKIKELLPDITGIENASGEILKKGSQKFVKTQFKTSDNGGYYVLTQYITVANKKNIVLSFYTTVGDKSDYDYIEKTFESFDSAEWKIERDNDSSLSTAIIVVGAAIIIFGIICILTMVTLIIDIRRKPNEAYIEEIENDE